MPREIHCVRGSILPSSTLESDGWERRFITDVDRADEAVEIYSKLGFDVYVEQVLGDELGDECNECALVATCQFRTIYTRIKALPDGEGSVPYEQGDRDPETRTPRD